MRKVISPRKRQIVFERDNFTCVNCGAKGDFNALEIDHIIPVADGGTNDYKNLQTLCYRCNMDKLWGKNIKNKEYIDLTPLEKLTLIKERLELYKHLTYSEFRVVFTQDRLFKSLRLDLSYLNDLFGEISGQAKNLKAINNGDKDTRDRYIKYLYKNTDLTQEQIAEVGGIGSKTVWNALHKEQKPESRFL